jgi:hypothetical protein
MPEFVRIIAARLRRFLVNSRSAKRLTRRLPCTVGLAASRAGTVDKHADVSLEGYTYDVSATGLSLLMPATHIKGRYLTGAGTKLLILIELPESPILLEGVAVRYERLEQDVAEMKYLLGVQITEISDEYRTRLQTLLK